MTEMNREPWSHTLPNGLRLVCLPGPTASVTLGLWLHDGSRFESADRSGWTHLLEHLWFRRTASRDGVAIAQAVDRLGGRVNAYSGRELTVLHGQAPGKRFGELTTLLLELLIGSDFTDADVNRERALIAQELAGLEYDPEATAARYLLAKVWPNHPLGREIVGTPASLARADAAALHRYRRERLVGHRLCVVAVGAVQPEQLLKLCEPLAGLPPGEAPTVVSPNFVRGRYRKSQPYGQTWLLRLMPSPATGSPDFAAAAFADQILGGGLSSRLVQCLREDLGLVYDARSWLESFSDTGLWWVQVSCNPAAADRVERELEASLLDLARRGPSEQELAVARQRSTAGLQLADDDPMLLMERLGRECLLSGTPEPIESRRLAGRAVDADRISAWVSEGLTRQASLRWGGGSGC
jgi:predicted Zn-dependent peptidase